MEYQAEKSNITRTRKVAMSTIFDEIIHKYSQTTSIESMQPGQTIKGTDGVSYTVVKDNASGEKFFAPQQTNPNQPAQQTQQEQQVQQPQDSSQQNQDPNQYAMNPPEGETPKPEPMGAKTSRKRKAQELSMTEQDWADLADMGGDIAQEAKKRNMRGIMEILEDLTNFALTFVNLPENVK